MFWTIFFACLLSQIVFALVGGALMFALPRLVARFYRPVLDEVESARPSVVSTPLSDEQLSAEQLAVLESMRLPEKRQH